jgi:hypothetical protein
MDTNGRYCIQQVCCRQEPCMQSDMPVIAELCALLQAGIRVNEIFDDWVGILNSSRVKIECTKGVEIFEMIWRATNSAISIISNSEACFLTAWQANLGRRSAKARVTCLCSFACPLCGIFITTSQKGAHDITHRSAMKALRDKQHAAAPTPPIAYVSIEHFLQ